MTQTSFKFIAVSCLSIVVSAFFFSAGFRYMATVLLIGTAIYGGLYFADFNVSTPVFVIGTSLVLFLVLYLDGVYWSLPFDGFSKLLLVFTTVLFLSSAIHIRLTGTEFDDYAAVSGISAVLLLLIVWNNNVVEHVQLPIVFGFLLIMWFLTFDVIIHKQMPKIIAETFGRKPFPSGWGQAAFVTVVMGTALILRLQNLDSLPPYPDEYAHLIAARKMLSGTLFPAYERGFAITTVPVYFSFELLGPSLYKGRLAPVIFNSLTIIPLFLFLRRINWMTAATGVLLYAFNPWVVAVSRYVREYAILPFYTLLTALLLLTLVSRVPAGYVVRDLPRIVSDDRRLQGLLALALVPPFYAIIIDSVSSTKTLLLLYPAAYVVLLTKSDLSDSETFWSYVLFTLTATVSGLYGLHIVPNVTAVPTYSGFPLELFLFNPDQQWFYDLNTSLIALFLVLGLYAAFYAKNTTMRFSGLTFLFSLYFFIFHFSRYYRPRYGFYIQLWYVCIVSIGIILSIAILWDSLRIAWSQVFGQLNRTNGWPIGKIASPRTVINVGILVVILVAFVNPAQTLLAVTLHEDYSGSYVEITNEYHPNAEEGLAPLKTYQQSADIILIDGKNYLIWHYPEVYEQNTIKRYICDPNGLPPGVDADMNVIFATKHRATSPSCIDELPGSFRQVADQEQYNIYINFDIKKGPSTS